MILPPAAWYDRQKVGLGDEFLGAVNGAFERLADQPELYAAVHGEVRRMKMRRFPYVVYYVAFADSIEIIGVLHAARDPRRWRSRL